VSELASEPTSDEAGARLATAEAVFPQPTFPGQPSGREAPRAPEGRGRLRSGPLEEPRPIVSRVAESPLLPLSDQLFQRLLRERIIFLGQQVDDDIANRICAELLLLSAEDGQRDIYLYINSPGGSVTAGMAIYDIMQYVPNDVATVGMGLAASMGQFLLCAGAHGKRFALPHARIMMHQPSGGIGGTASDIKIQAEQMLYVKKTLAERIAFHTGQPLDQIERDSDRDRWFTAEEARDYGFVDSVVLSANQVPSEGPVS
jgi:ATP-dependent Clp protease protease subunit